VTEMKGEYFEFLKKHPEIDIGLMLDTFEKCQGKQPKDLQEAYNHVYEGNCRWCKKRIELWEEAQRNRRWMSEVRDWQVGRYPY